MEDVKLKAFLEPGYVDGDGSGDGSGYGYGYGSGYGYGYGSGDGDGSGDGYGSGYGYGYGSGSGDGSGDGSGYGDGYGLKEYNGRAVNNIDGLPTVITHIRENVAEGYVVRKDLTPGKCFVVKQGSVFAHGADLHAARDSLLSKLFEDMPKEERISEFVKAHTKGVEYPDTDYFEWHHRLTGSCLMGRTEFAKEHGLEALDGKRTPEEFIALTENSYGGDIIRELKEFYK